MKIKQVADFSIARIKGWIEILTIHTENNDQTHSLQNHHSRMRTTTKTPYFEKNKNEIYHWQSYTELCTLGKMKLVKLLKRCVVKSKQSGCMTTVNHPLVFQLSLAFSSQSSPIQLVLKTYICNCFNISPDSTRLFKELDLTTKCSGLLLSFLHWNYLELLLD